jgi:hypothetical protein
MTNWEIKRKERT